MNVFIERSIGGKYVVSKLQEYQLQYSVDYTTYNTGYNIFYIPMNEIFPPTLSTKYCYETRYKSGIAISSSLYSEKDALNFIRKLGKEYNYIPNPKLHTSGVNYGF